MLVMRKNTINHSGKKTKKMVKQSKMITEQPKPIEKPNIVDIKSVIKEQQKASRKLFKTIRLNESDADDVFESIYIKIISNMEKLLGESSSEIID